MSINNIEEVASYIVSEGKGILAADESNPTCGKRFDSIGVESTEHNRRDYREMLFRSAGMEGNIGGVILFDETIRQQAKDGTLLVDIINNQGALPGIKVDKGLHPIVGSLMTYASTVSSRCRYGLTGMKSAVASLNDRVANGPRAISRAR